MITIDREFIKITEDMQIHSSDRLENMQKAKTPQYFDIKAERVYTYLYGNSITMINTNSETLLYIKELKIKNLNKRRNKLQFKDTMLNMIKNNEIHPFLLFINGKFIKWSKISIIFNYSKQYILINDKIITVNDVSAIYIPFNVNYTEKGSGFVIGKELFGFDDNGLSSITGTSIISTTNNSIAYNSAISNIGLKCIDSKLLVDEKLFACNLILFKDGLLYKDANIDIYALNMFTVDSGNSGSELEYKVFYSKSSNKSKELITGMKNYEKAKEILRNNIVDNVELPYFFDSFLKEFKYDYDTDNYAQNFYKSYEYLYGYNANIYNSWIQKQKLDIKTISYTGEEINSKKNSEGYLILPRHRISKEDEYVMIFVNYQLYKYYKHIQYETNRFKIPIIDISDTDSIELIFFKNINNNISNAIIKNDDDNINNIFPGQKPDFNKVQFYSEEIPYTEYLLPKNGRVQYLIPYKIDKNEETGKDRIYLEDEYISLYNKPLTVTFKNQFRYVGYTIQEDTISVVLSPDFNYCHDKYRYMIFINGNFISKDNYEITIPGKDLPFDDISVYTNIPLLPNDRIDIFYLPIFLDMEYVSGYDVNSPSVLPNFTPYEFSKNLMLLFINGKKVSTSILEDFTSTSILVTKNAIKSDEYITYIDTINESEKNSNNIFLEDNVISSIDDFIGMKLPGYSNENYTLWDLAMLGTTSDEEFNKLMNLLNITLEPLDIDAPDFDYNRYDLEKIVKEIIRDYYLRSGYAGTGSIFVFDSYYDYTFTKDEHGNIILDLMDASLENNLAPGQREIEPEA